jgi:hypothetical protein
VTKREPLLQSAEEAAEIAMLDRYFGPWDPFDPTAVAAFLDGFSRPWWIVGGWSIEAFTGVPREHEDVDVSLLACDVPTLRKHVGDRYQLWNVFSGAFRPLLDRWVDQVEPDSQIWVRRELGSPWLLDIVLTPDREGLWTNKRDPDHVLSVEEATWVADDGLRYQRPEITLLFKAKQTRLKDDRDLAVTWPLLAADRRAWLRDAVARLYPGHPWLAGLLA